MAHIGAILRFFELNPQTLLSFFADFTRALSRTPRATLTPKTPEVSIPDFPPQTSFVFSFVMERYGIAITTSRVLPDVVPGPMERFRSHKWMPKLHPLIPEIMFLEHE